MPFPSGATTITVTINRPIPAGGAGNSGRIIFTPSAVLVDATHKAIYSGAGTATLDANGTASITLLTTDAAGVLPAGWQWQVDEQLPGARRTYYVALPSTLGATVDLSALSPVSAPNGSGQSLPPTGAAGGALAGSYPNPQLSPAAIASFDSAGSAATAQTAAQAYADSTKLAKTANLSDLGSINTARTNLGLGGAALLNVGTTAGTVAAGDDSRITGAAQKAANLSDLANPATSRTNLGLGGAALLNVGTIAGTVAAGNDSRLSDARTPTAHAPTHGLGASDPVTLDQTQVTGLTTALSGKLPLTGGSITGDVSVTGRLTTSGWTLPLLAPSTRLPAWRSSSYLQNFQTGHGWTTSGSGLGSSNLNDTSTFVRGTQCATITSAGTAGVANLDRFAQPSFDLTGKAIRLTLKIDDITHVNSVNFFVGTSSLANSLKWKAWNTTASTSMIQSGEWVTVTLQWADINAAAGTYSISTNGVPSSTSNFTDMRFQIVDDGAGTVTAHLQSVEIIPDTTSTFPNGVVSITFDDSWQSVHDYARPAMDQYGYRGTSYTITDYIGTSQRLTLAELRSVQNLSGWEVAGHAYTNAAHAARYDTLTAQQVDDELRNLKAWLVTNEFTSDAFAYPGGHFAATTDGVPVDQLVGRYFSTGRSINYLNTTEMFPAAMPKRMRSISGISSIAVASDNANPTKLMSAGGPLDRCQLNGSWLILTFHQIVTGSVTDATQCSQTDFASIMAAISSRNIPVLPVGDVIRNYL